MAKPQHRTPEYQAAYRALRAAQARGEWHVCVEPVCLFTSRDIAPWQRASVSHDPSGTVILGPSHLRCNLSEAARRGNRMRALGLRGAPEVAPRRRTTEPTTSLWWRP